MYLNSAEFHNFKSFRTDDNKIYFEKGKTTIIGVNESGKSNILELIGRINLKSNLPTVYSKIVNNNEEKTENAYIELSFLFNEEDLAEIKETTQIRYYVGRPPVIDGALRSLIENDTNIQDAITLFETGKKYVVRNGNNLPTYNEQLNLLKDAGKSFIQISSLGVMINVLSPEVNKDEYKKTLSSAQDRISYYYSLIPEKIHRTAIEVREIKSVYFTDEAKKLATTDDSLRDLTLAAGLTIEEMINAFTLPDSNNRKTLRRHIEKSIRKVCEKFRDFYDRSDYEFEIKFETDRLYVNVITAEKVLTVSERSNGLRWFFSLFLQMNAIDYENKNVIYLLDEPGVFLHVNAQHDLLRLFDVLSAKRGQVIYSTHLPTMIDNNNLGCIRRVEKDESGVSHIFNKYYVKGLDASLSRKETLTPVLYSLGCNLDYLLPISLGKNIITEGPTDKLYLEAAYCFLGVDTQETPRIVAAQGADNVRNVFSILSSWGCDCVALYDYDKEGFTQYYKMLKVNGDDVKKRIIFVKEEPVPSNPNEQSVSECQIEGLISKDVWNQMETPYNKTNDTKAIAAFEFNSKVKNGMIRVDDLTRSNFRKLLERICERFQQKWNDNRV